MSKIKNLSDLGSLYNMVQENAANMPAIVQGNKQPDILLTDANRYLPQSSMLNENAPKAGNALGSDKEKEELAKGTGPDAAGNFKKGEAKEKQEASKMSKKEEDEMEAAEKNEEAPEKMEETVDSSSRTPKYNKQQFTMPKSKFQKLYEDAVNGVPFIAQEEEQMTPIEPSADHEEPSMGGPEGDEGEEECCTHEEAIEMVEKLMKFLQKDKAYDQEHGDLGDEDKAFTQGEEENESDMPMEEAVETEDLGHANVGSGVKTEMGKDGHKIQKVGGAGVTKVKGAATEQGASFKNEPAPKKEKESGMVKDGHKLHTVGNLTPDKGEGSNMFTK